MRRTGILAVVICGLLAAPAAAQLPPIPTVIPPVPTVPPIGEQRPEPQAYQANDGKGFRNILPSGTRGLSNAAAARRLPGHRRDSPPHCYDQLGMYSDLIYATPACRPRRSRSTSRTRASACRAGDVERTLQPARRRHDRARQGLRRPAHLRRRRATARCSALGYATAEDRLFFMDVFRHARPRRSSRRSPAARATAPCDERAVGGRALHRGGPPAPDRPAAAGLLRRAGRADPAPTSTTTSPASTSTSPRRSSTRRRCRASTRRSASRRARTTWKGTDVDRDRLAGRRDLRRGRRRRARRRRSCSSRRSKRASAAAGAKRVWQRLPLGRRPRGADDRPQASASRTRRRPSSPRRAPALPDRGSLKRDAGRGAQRGAAAARRGRARGLLGELLAFPTAMSNALLVSGARVGSRATRSPSFGPQVGYFAPQILMEQDVHAPAAGGPASTPAARRSPASTSTSSSAAGATTRGARRRPARTSSTRSRSPTLPATTTRTTVFRGQCLPIEVLERTNAWQPNAGRQTPAGTRDAARPSAPSSGSSPAAATIERQAGRSTRKLRSTYGHEVDSGVGFLRLQRPRRRSRSPQDFQRAARRSATRSTGSTPTTKHIAYFNSGANPVRPKGIDPEPPDRGRQVRVARLRPGPGARVHAARRSTRRWSTRRTSSSWNNKQAHGYGGCRRQLRLRVRLPLAAARRTGSKRLIAGERKMTLPELVDAMEEAGTVDLRGDEVLPLALKVHRHGPTRPGAARRGRRAARVAARRRATGCDGDGDGVYEHADAIRIMDAWWPLLGAGAVRAGARRQGCSTR